MAEFLGGLTGWCWAHRRPLIALVVVFMLITPQPARGQFIDWAPIVGAINAINTAITNVIGLSRTPRTVPIPVMSVTAPPMADPMNETADPIAINAMPAAAPAAATLKIVTISSRF